VPRIFRQSPVRAAEIATLPAFRYEEEPFIAVAGRVLPGIAGLSLPILLLGWLALPGLRRYPVLG